MSRRTPFEPPMAAGYAWFVRNERPGTMELPGTRHDEFITRHDWLAADMERIDGVSVSIIWWDRMSYALHP